MSYKNTNPTGAKDLLDGNEGWTYVDVRSTPEFEAGHVPGAYHVPLAERGPGGMEPNPDFADVMQKHFAKDQKLVIGCAAGGRSARACEVLSGCGYTNLVNMHGGFSGMRDPSGQVAEAGWESLGFPCATDAPPERCYSALR